MNMETIQMNNKSYKICTRRCVVCTDTNVGTVDEAGDFLCANCDRPAFDIASELQKESYLAGANLQGDEVL